MPVPILAAIAIQAGVGVAVAYVGERVISAPAQSNATPTGSARDKLNFWQDGIQPAEAVAIAAVGAVALGVAWQMKAAR